MPHACGWPIGNRDVTGSRQVSGKASEEWKNAFIERLRKPTNKGDYKTAVKIAKQAMAQYPDEFICRYQYAKLLGDWADELPPKEKRAKKTESIRILRPLLKSLRGVPSLTRFGVCLNYYYQSADFAGMFAFSKRFARYDRQKSWYGQGLAGALLAQSYYDRDLLARSRQWAEKGSAAWSRYHLAKDPYYFAHYSAAKAAALAGRHQEARRHLQRAARLAKRPITDWEFADVLAILK